MHSPRHRRHRSRSRSRRRSHRGGGDDDDDEVQLSDVIERLETIDEKIERKEIKKTRLEEKIEELESERRLLNKLKDDLEKLERTPTPKSSPGPQWKKFLKRQQNMSPVYKRQRLFDN